jgi:hypothetical protein
MASKKATQEVVIELSNGVKGIFVGRAIAWPGQNDGISIVGVKFFAPKVKEQKKEAPVEPPVAKPPVAPTPEKPVDVKGPAKH